VTLTFGLNENENEKCATGLVIAKGF